MKRTPIQRRSPMPPGSTPLVRRSLPRSRAPRPVRDTVREAAWSDLRLALFARCGGRCERCGADLADVGMDGAHRKARSQGGPNTPVNVAALCRRDHAWCHANPAAAKAEGWMVAPWGDPATVGVTLHNGRTVWFTEDGGYADEAPAVELGTAS